MKNKTDLELIEAVKASGDNEAFLEICRRYENIFYKICQRYTGALKVSGLDIKDIFDEKNYIIFHCVNTFKPSKKTKLSTWIGNFARYLCLNAINNRRFILPSCDEDIQKHIEDSQSVDSYIHNGRPNEEYKYILNLLSQVKDKRIPQIFKYRYCVEPKKMAWFKIAKKMNISAQTSINLHNKGLELIKRKIRSQTISDIV